MTATASTAHGAGQTPVRAALRDPYVRALVAITLAAAVIRFAVMGIPSYWLDEGFTVVILKGSLRHALDTIPDTESTPPLYYVLAWGWAKAFGYSEDGVRSFSALCGVLTVPVAAATAARLADRRTALIAAAMLATNPFLVWFAQEARAYALMVLLAAIGFHLFVRLLDRPDARTFAGWAVVSVLLLATHYYGALMIAAEAGWLLGARPALRRPTLASLAAVGVALVALAPLAITQRHNEFAVPLAESSSTLLRTVQVPKQFLVGFDAPAELLLAVVCAALVLAGVALLAARRPAADRRRLHPAAFVGLAVVVVPVLFGAVGFDFVSARYEIAAIVPLTICVAAGFAAPAAKRLGLALALALVAIWAGIVVAVAADPLLQTRADWRHAAEALGAPPPGGRAIVLTPASGRKSFQIYLPGAREIATPVVSVSEIDILSVRSSQDEALGTLAPPPGAPRQDVPPSFKEAGRKRTRTYMLIRYRSRGPATIAINTLGGLRLDDEEWVGLVER
jgi:mannosyltransferase